MLELPVEEHLHREDHVVEEAPPEVLQEDQVVQ